MKVIAVCGSPRKNGNTQILLEKVCEILENEGILTELILLAEKEIKPCTCLLYTSPSPRD